MGRERFPRVRESCDFSCFHGKPKRLDFFQTATNFKLHHHHSPFHRPLHNQYMSHFHRPQYHFHLPSKIHHEEWRPARNLLSHGGAYGERPVVRRAGNRGFTRLFGRRGLREPLPSYGDHTKQTYTTLFVDRLHRMVDYRMLGNLFAVVGVVGDVFISKKIRKNKSWGFGFVRFKQHMDAIAAIKTFNGSMFMGNKISIAFAKFNKLGQAFRQKNERKNNGNSSGPLVNYSWKVKHHGVSPSYRVIRTDADESNTLLVEPTQKIDEIATCSKPIQPILNPDPTNFTNHLDTDLGCGRMDRRLDVTKDGVVGENNVTLLPKEAAASIQRTDMVVLEDTNGSSKQVGLMEKGEAVDSSLKASKYLLKFQSTRELTQQRSTMVN